MFTKVFKIILSHAVLVTLVMFSKDICRFSLKNMSLIKIYRTPTTTNERLPTEQQNGYHGFATEQFIEGAYIHTFQHALYIELILSVLTIHNKAIRDDKYLARHMPVLGNVHPIKIENVDIFFRDVISLLARVVILLIDTATQEVPMKKYLKEIVSPFLLDTPLNCYVLKVAHVTNDVK